MDITLDMISIPKINTYTVNKTKHYPYLQCFL